MGHLSIFPLSREAFAEITGSSAEQAGLRIERYIKTFLTMKPWLSSLNVGGFLDIGCGLGGVSLLVAAHYPGALINLIDGVAPGEKFRYQDDGVPWADVNVARRVIHAAFPDRTVLTCPPTNDALVPPCDLIYSNCSWGHHYAIEAYLSLVKRCLMRNGTLIVDLRANKIGQHGREVLQEYFSYTGTVHVGGKYVRTAWTPPTSGGK